MLRENTPRDEDLMIFENTINQSAYDENGEQIRNEKSQITMDSNLLDDSQWYELEKSQQYLD